MRDIVVSWYPHRMLEMEPRCLIIMCEMNVWSVSLTRSGRVLCITWDLLCIWHMSRTTYLRHGTVPSRGIRMGCLRWRKAAHILRARALVWLAGNKYKYVSTHTHSWTLRKLAGMTEYMIANSIQRYCTVAFVNRSAESNWRRANISNIQWRHIEHKRLPTMPRRSVSVLETNSKKA